MSENDAHCLLSGGEAGSGTLSEQREKRIERDTERVREGKRAQGERYRERA